MIEFTSKVGFIVVQCIFQILIGTVIGVLAFQPIHKWVQNRTLSLAARIAFITGASLFGLVVPFSTYGLIPIFLMLVKAGLKPHLVLPSMIANYLFNMLIPFNTPNFTWATGYLRIIVAFCIAVLGGLLLIPSVKAQNRIQIKNSLNFYTDTEGVRSIPKSAGKAIGSLGAYILCGALAETLFRQYVLFTVTSQVFSNESTGVITNSLMQFNIVNPLFLLAVDFLYALVNFVGISALLSVFKIKSFFLFVFHVAACALLLSLSMFIK